MIAETVSVSPSAPAAPVAVFANMSEVDAKIVEIQEAFQAIEAHAPTARNAFFWRMFTYFGSGPAAADVLVSNIQNIVNALPGLYEGVCQHAPRKDLSSKMALVNDFERKRIVWQKEIEVLSFMRSESFIRMFEIIQQQAAKVKSIVDSPDVGGQLSQLQNVVKECESVVLEYPKREFAIELFKIIHAAGSVLKEKLDNQVDLTGEFQEGINQFLMINKRRIEELPLKSNFERDLGNAEGITDETRAALQQIISSKHEFGVWKEYSFASQAFSKVTGSCAETIAHGNLMEDDIGKRIAGLLDALQERITILCEQELTEVQAMTVRRELNEYHQYILTIRQKLLEQSNQIWGLPQNVRQETLRNYAHGLHLSLLRAQDVLLLCRDFSKKHAVDVARIYVLMQRYLGRAVSPIADVASFEDTAALFTVGIQLRAIKQIAMVEVCDDPQVDSYITRTQQIVERLFVRTATESCALREEEKLVFDVVMQGESLDGLYYKKESKTLLPKRVQVVIIKRATAALLLAKDAPLVSADGPVDSELELLFHILHTTPLYAETLKSVPEFAAVMEEYTSWHQTYRRDDFLKRAYVVLWCINKALTQKPDVFDFAKLIQIYVDFTRDPISFANEERFAEPVKKRHRSLMKLLFKRLCYLAEVKAYPQPIETYLNKKLNSFLTYDDDSLGQGLCFAVELENLARNHKFKMTTDEAKKVLFDAAVFRLVSACLYENETSNKVAAQTELRHLLELHCYKEYRPAISEYTKKLLYENTTNRLLSGDLLVDRNESYELSLYREGPIEEFLAHELNTVEHNNVRHAMWKIVLQEGVLPQNKRPVTNRFQEVLALQLGPQEGQEAFVEWCKTYRDFMISSIKDKAYLEKLAAGDAGTKEIMGLEIKYGKAEVAKIRESASRVLAYTSALSALQLALE